MLLCFCAWSFGYNKGNRSFFDALRPCELVGYHAHCLVGARSADDSRCARHEAWARGEAHRQPSDGARGGGLRSGGEVTAEVMVGEVKVAIVME